MMGVDSPQELAKSGAKVARFLADVDHPHGPFNVDILIRCGNNPPQIVPYSAVNHGYRDYDDDDDEDGDFVPEDDGGGGGTEIVFTPDSSVFTPDTGEAR
jgi:hypothetical protein